MTIIERSSTDPSPKWPTGTWAIAGDSTVTHQGRTGTVLAIDAGGLAHVDFGGTVERIPYADLKAQHHTQAGDFDPSSTYIDPVAVDTHPVKGWSSNLDAPRRSWADWDEEHPYVPSAHFAHTAKEAAAGQAWGEAGKAAEKAKSGGVKGFLSKKQRKAAKKAASAPKIKTSEAVVKAPKYTPEETAAYLAKKAADAKAQAERDAAYAASRAPNTGQYGARDLHTEGTWAPRTHQSRYGGVMFDPQGRVLLREPLNHFDGTAYTFSKGHPDRTEHPTITAIRETEEETGLTPNIVGHVPGGFGGSGTGSVNHYYLMHDSGNAFDPSMMNGETNSLVWATPAQADAMVQQGTNKGAVHRDRSVLRAAIAAHSQAFPQTPKYPDLEPVPAPPPPPAPPKPKAPKASKSWQQPKQTGYKGMWYPGMPLPGEKRDWAEWNAEHVAAGKAAGQKWGAAGAAAEKAKQGVGKTKSAAAKPKSAATPKISASTAKADNAFASESTDKELSEVVGSALQDQHAKWQQYLHHGVRVERSYAVMSGWDDDLQTRNWKVWREEHPYEATLHGHEWGHAWGEAAKKGEEAHEAADKAKEGVESTGALPKPTSGKALTPEQKAERQNLTDRFTKEAKSIHKYTPGSTRATNFEQGYADARVHAIEHNTTAVNAHEKSNEHDVIAQNMQANQARAKREGVAAGYHAHSIGFGSSTQEAPGTGEATQAGVAHSVATGTTVDLESTEAATLKAQQAAGKLAEPSTGHESIKGIQQFNPAIHEKVKAKDIQPGDLIATHQDGKVYPAGAQTPEGFKPTATTETTYNGKQTFQPVTSVEIGKTGSTIHLAGGENPHIGGGNATVYARLKPAASSVAPEASPSSGLESIEAAIGKAQTEAETTPKEAPPASSVPPPMTKATHTYVKIVKMKDLQPGDQFYLYGKPHTVQEKWYKPSNTAKGVNKGYVKVTDHATGQTSSKWMHGETEYPSVLKEGEAPKPTPTAPAHHPLEGQTVYVHHGKNVYKVGAAHLSPSGNEGKFYIKGEGVGTIAAPDEIHATEEEANAAAGLHVNTGTEKFNKGYDTAQKVGPINPLDVEKPTIETSEVNADVAKPVTPPIGHLGGPPQTEADLKLMKPLSAGEKFSNGETVPATGTNGGKWYEDANGQGYFLKGAQSDEHAMNEVAGSLAYQQAGVTAQKVSLVKMNDGSVRAMSHYMTGLKPILSTKDTDDTTRASARTGAGMDALMSHYDLTGMVTASGKVDGPNLFKDAEGNVVRLDLGGTGRFRAQGNLKKHWKPGDWASVSHDQNDYETIRGGDQGKLAYGVTKAGAENIPADMKASLDKAADLDIGGYHDSMLANGVSKKFADEQAAVVQQRQEHLKSMGFGTQAPPSIEPSETTGTKYLPGSPKHKAFTQAHDDAIQAAQVGGYTPEQAQQYSKDAANVAAKLPPGIEKAHREGVAAGYAEHAIEQAKPPKFTTEVEPAPAPTAQAAAVEPPKYVTGARLENTSGSSNKFYESLVHANSDGTFTHTTRYGSMMPGSHVTENAKVYKSHAEATSAHFKAVDTRMSHGYSGVGEPIDKSVGHVPGAPTVVASTHDVATSPMSLSDAIAEAAKQNLDYNAQYDKAKAQTLANLQAGYANPSLLPEQLKSQMEESNNALAENNAIGAVWHHATAKGMAQAHSEYANGAEEHESDEHELVSAEDLKPGDQISFDEGQPILTVTNVQPGMANINVVLHTVDESGTEGIHPVHKEYQVFKVGHTNRPQPGESVAAATPTAPAKPVTVPEQVASEQGTDYLGSHVYGKNIGTEMAAAGKTSKQIKAKAATFYAQAKQKKAVNDTTGHAAALGTAHGLVAAANEVGKVPSGLATSSSHTEDVEAQALKSGDQLLINGVHHTLAKEFDSGDGGLSTVAPEDVAGSPDWEDIEPYMHVADAETKFTKLLPGHPLYNAADGQSFADIFSPTPTAPASTPPLKIKTGTALLAKAAPVKFTGDLESNGEPFHQHPGFHNDAYDKAYNEAKTTANPTYELLSGADKAQQLTPSGSEAAAGAKGTFHGLQAAEAAWPASHKSEAKKNQEKEFLSKVAGSYTSKEPFEVDGTTTKAVPDSIPHGVKPAHATAASSVGYDQAIAQGYDQAVAASFKGMTPQQINGAVQQTLDKAGALGSPSDEAGVLDQAHLAGLAQGAGKAAVDLKKSGGDIEAHHPNASSKSIISQGVLADKSGKGAYKSVTSGNPYKNNQSSTQLNFTPSELGAVSTWKGSFRYHKGASFVKALDAIGAGKNPGSSSAAQSAKKIVSLYMDKAEPNTQPIQRKVKSLPASILEQWTTVGSEISIPLTSWSTDPNAWSGQVWLHAPPGTVSLDIGRVVNYESEVETISGGQFVVKSVKVEGGITHIYLEQTAALVS